MEPPQKQWGSGDLLAFLRSGSVAIAELRVMMLQGFPRGANVLGSTSLKITLYTQDGLPPSSESPPKDPI